MAQTILITGCSGGFGRLMTQSLARQGHTIIATMRGVEGKNKALADQFWQQAQQEGWALHILELDVTSDASIETAVQAALAQVGQIDVVINNAGVGSAGMVEAFTPEKVQQLYDINVFGVLRVNRAILPHMRARGSGLVVYISSGLGRFLFPFMGVYSSTKWAIEALAETSNFELAPLGIETAIVQPGAYGTDFGANALFADDQARVATYGPVAEFMGKFFEGFSSRQLPDPQEVADAIVHLINLPKGQRPLRTPVGQDATHMAGPINEAAAKVQTQIQAILSQRH